MTASILPSMKGPLRQSFEAKQLQTQGIIAKWIRSCPPEKQAIGFSGGKDSTAIVHMVMGAATAFLPEGSFKKISVVFGNTGVEYSETVNFVHDLQKQWGFNLIELKPKSNFWECIKKDGHYPRGKSVRGKHTDTCCLVLKENPMKKAIKEYGFEVLYDGITALESRNRMIRGAIDGTCHFAQKWKINKVHPILYWSESEVWQYIGMNHIPSNPIYSMGAKRCGCMVCTAHNGWQDELSKINPKMLHKILKDMGQNQLSE
jgi:phosphoadenosine phosphosulfate reductase